ncbi:universal stress protein [Streptomyces ficellus]|uniref:Universal stress protein n=1 Tax=Streptomyces ficellus TaxID=1977088 RepID=A0A6I6FB15_9ACTN|nr:universal stress protein [Streptomyces ficellus]QGV77352.1 universal stress protein [Streptomyces ficellus]
MSGNITVGVDGSPESLTAVRWAAHEAELRQAPLRLVQGGERPVPSMPFSPYASTRSRQADRILRSTAEEVRSRYPGLTVTTERLTCRADHALIAEANESGDVDLMVLGSRGLAGMDGFLIGPVGLAVVGASERPVVLVRPGTVPLTGSGDVVVGVDLHESPAALLGFAFREASRRQRTLRVVNVWGVPATYGLPEDAAPETGLEFHAVVDKTLEEALAPWQREFPAVPVVARAVTGVVGAQLVYASVGADLLIVGRHERRAPMGPRMGHVVHAVIHHAAAPVVVVPQTRHP